MKVAYSCRLYPDGAQRQALSRAFGCARVVYNDAASLRRRMYDAGQPFMGDAECQWRIITFAKTTEERAFLNEVSSVVLIEALAGQHQAWRNFSGSLKGKRKGRKIGRPRFRSKKDRRQSVRLTRNGFSIRLDGRLYVAKVGEIETRWTRDLPSEPSSVTIVRDAILAVQGGASSNDQ